MDKKKKQLLSLTQKRLTLQKNYEPKLRSLVETRTHQKGFDESEKNNAVKSIDAFTWKITASGIHLERLWDFHESRLLAVMLEKIQKGEPEPKRFQDDEIAYLLSEFEAFLFQARSIIYMAQIHTLDAFKIPFGGQMTNKKYRKIIKGTSNNDLSKIGNYFEDEVFGDIGWGSLIRSLRDRVAHFDRIRPSKQISDKGFEELTVTGLTLERLSQDYENGIYDLIVSVICQVWDRSWIPGPYRSGMWK